jgi:large subunit ribosomal protein L5
MEKSKEIKIEKLTLNCGTNVDQHKLERAMKLLQIMTGSKPIKCISNKRIPAWGVRLGLALGCKVTIRGKKAYDLIRRILEPIGNKLKARQFTPGNVAFGIKEYIEIPGMQFQREVGIMGFEACVTLTRPGYRIERKKLKAGKIPKRHRITKQETIDFMKQNFNTQIIEKQERQ